MDDMISKWDAINVLEEAVDKAIHKLSSCLEGAEIYVDVLRDVARCLDGMEVAE